MKICPECKTEYDDPTLELCPHDDMPLVVVVKIPKNPEIPEVVEGTESEITSDFDLEAVAGELEKLESEEAQPAAEPTTTERESAPPKTLPEPTQTIPDKKPRKKGKRKLILAMSALAVACIAIATAIYFWLASGIIIELRSDPKGATVILDGKNIGTAPLKKRVKAGTHEVEFIMPGYETHRETVIVSPKGKAIIKKLKKNSRK